MAQDGGAGAVGSAEEACGDAGASLERAAASLSARGMLQDLLVVDMVLEALEAGGVSEALSVLALADPASGASGGRSLVMLAPTFRTTEVDTTRTLASAAPLGGTSMSVWMLRLSTRAWFKYVLTLSTLVYSVLTNLYWAEKVGASSLVAALAVWFSLHTVVVNLVNLRALMVVVRCFNFWFWVFQVLQFTVCGALLFQTAERRWLWALPGLAAYLPMGVLDAMPDRSLMWRSYLIGSAGFSVGWAGLLAHLFVFEDQLVTVLGFEVSLLSRTYSAHAAFVAFMANQLWNAVFAPERLVSRPDIKFVLASRDEAEMLVGMSRAFLRAQRGWAATVTPLRQAATAAASKAATTVAAVVWASGAAGQRERECERAGDESALANRPSARASTINGLLRARNGDFVFAARTLSTALGAIAREPDACERERLGRNALQTLQALRACFMDSVRAVPSFSVAAASIKAGSNLTSALPVVSLSAAAAAAAGSNSPCGTEPAEPGESGPSLVLLLASTWQVRPVDTLDTLAARLGGQRLQSVLASACRSRAYHCAACALWPASLAAALVALLDRADARIAMAMTVAVLLDASLQCLLLPRIVRKAFARDKFMLVYMGFLTALLAVSGWLVLEDAQHARLWPLTLCFSLAALLNDEASGAGDTSFRRLLQFPSLTLYLWASAASQHAGLVRRRANLVRLLLGTVTLDVNENLVPTTVTVAVLCTYLTYRALVVRNELTGLVGLGKFQMSPWHARQLLAKQRVLLQLQAVRRGMRQDRGALVPLVALSALQRGREASRTRAGASSKQLVES
jgi:hypothetical protein